MLAGAVEQVLRSDSHVQDVCVVGEGATAVAWVVPRRAIRSGVLEALLRERLGEQTPCVALIDAIPILDSGEPDREALSRLTPATPAFLQHLEARFHQAGREAVALSGPRQHEERFDPLDELLPESLRPRTGAALSATTAIPGPAADGSSELAGPSLLEGGPRRGAPGAATTLGELLRHAARVHADRTVTFIDVEGGRETLRYADLWEEALRLWGGLGSLGVKTGERVILLMDRPGDYVRAFWACTLGGVVPVPMAWPASFDRSHASIARILSVSERLGGPLVLTNAQAAPVLSALGPRAVALSSLDRSAAGQPVALSPSSPAVLSFTSGSTGRPKGVVLSQDNLLAMCDATLAGGWYSQEDLGLSWMPLDHVAGTAYPHLVSLRAGTSHVLVARDFVLVDVLRWLDLLTEFGATMSWAPNFAYGLVADRLARGERRAWKLSRVRVLSCAGEPIVAETMHRFTQPLLQDGLRPDALCPAWGMAETTSFFTFTRGVRTHPGEPHVQLGPPPAGSSLRVVDDQDVVVPQGTVGHLQVRGAAVLAGYLDDPELNAKSFTADGWFRTGDMAVLREGEMAISGRQKEVLIINGNNLYPQEIESVVEQVPGVLPSFAVACPTRVGGTQTDEVLVFFVPMPDAPPLGQLLRSIREAVARALGVQVGYLVPLAKHQVPKTELGKRGRTELRRRFEAGELAAERREAERLLGGASTLPRCLAVPRWVSSLQVTASEVSPAGSLLLVAGAAFSAPLRERLSGRRRVVCVEPGPALADEVGRAFEALAAEGQRFEDVVYVAGRAAPVEAISPLLRLVQALAPRVEGAPVQLRVVAPRLESASDSAVGPLLIPGLLWSAAAEVAGLDARLVWCSASPEEVARCVAAELEGLRAAREVSYREGLRLERAFSSWVPRKVDSPRSLKREGLYLVTGALGGVGQAWARHLRRSLGARLLLVGRRERDAVSEALVRELGDSEYVPVDVTDAAALGQVVRQAEARAGRAFDGAFHFAGTLESLSLGAQTPEALVRGASAHVMGALAIAQAFAARPEAVLVFASSLMGTLGAGLHASYCAASGFVERFAEALVAEGRRALAVSFSSIRATGMARDLMASPPGYRMLEPSQALASLVLAIESGASHVLVGVEGSALPWRAAGLGAGVPLEQAHVFVTQEAGAPALVAGADAVPHGVPGLPRLVDGTIDRAALAAEAFGEATGGPLGPLEEVVVEAFREVLGVNEVGGRSNFFSLGGSSLQATRVVARINERTGLRLRELALFEHPSVSELVGHLRSMVDPNELDVSQLSDAQVSLLLSALQPS
ncbi:SDR family NAD(P)-dependent oxidoreductase [Archangium violaceum]|nr:SDR family NAD(P)-dependent oxidoreductase [Archangium violaceum]